MSVHTDTDQVNPNAFPFACQGPTTAPEFYYGMSLRDYFAAAALNGFFASQAWMHQLDEKALAAQVTMADAISQLAYQYADAMLAQRKKP